MEVKIDNKGAALVAGLSVGLGALIYCIRLGVDIFSSAIIAIALTVIIWAAFTIIFKKNDKNMDDFSTACFLELPVLLVCAFFKISLNITIPLTIISFIVFSLIFINNDKAIKQDKAEKNFKEFCEECLKYDIKSLKNLRSDEKKQRLALIAKKYNIDTADLEVIQKFNMIRDQKKQEEQEKQEQKLEKAKQEDQAKYARLTQYAQFHGTDKPVTMFNDLAREVGRGGTAGFISKKKESDGAVMAGVASGIGGTVPALMSLSNTAQNNTVIRQQNEQIDAINMAIAAANQNNGFRAKKYREKADEFVLKLVSDMPSEEVFQHLKFTKIQKKVLSTGSVVVEAEVTVEGEVTVFDKPGFIDGYVIAEIYTGDEKAGEAVMVFPAHGSIAFHMEEKVYTYKDGGTSRFIKGVQTDPGKPIKLEGICLFCGKRGKKYTVKFVPGDLWIMEQ